MSNWREKNLRDRYGITPEECDRLHRRARHRCEICKKKAKKLCIDHCHTTGAIRGVICDNCNKGLGLLGDDEDGIKAAFDYLYRSRRSAFRHCECEPRSAIPLSRDASGRRARSYGRNARAAKPARRKRD